MARIQRHTISVQEERPKMVLNNRKQTLVRTCCGRKRAESFRGTQPSSHTDLQVADPGSSSTWKSKIHRRQCRCCHGFDLIMNFHFSLSTQKMFSSVLLFFAMFCFSLSKQKHATGSCHPSLIMTERRMR